MSSEILAELSIRIKLVI